MIFGNIQEIKRISGIFPINSIKLNYILEQKNTLIIKIKSKTNTKLNITNYLMWKIYRSCGNAYKSRLLERSGEDGCHLIPAKIVGNMTGFWFGNYINLMCRRIIYYVNQHILIYSSQTTTMLPYIVAQHN